MIKLHKIDTVCLIGAITGVDNYKEKFKIAEDKLKDVGYNVLTPTCLPTTLTYEKYFELTPAFIQASDAVYILDNWYESEGAKTEIALAKSLRKYMIYQELEDDNFKCPECSASMIVDRHCNDLSDTDIYCPECKCHTGCNHSCSDVVEGYYKLCETVRNK